MMPRFLRQFGLRTLLLFCTLTAVCFGLWRWHMTWVDAQYQLAEQIAEKRGDVSWSTWGPAWLHQTFGSRYFSTIVTVHWEHDNVKDDDVQLLGEIPTLEEVYLAGNPITDRGIKVLEKLPRVKKLSLWSTRVSDDGLASVAHLRNLEVLDIKHSQFTNEGLVHLRGMPKLRRLLFTLWLDDVGIDHLSTIPGITFKSLKTQNLTDVAIKKIRERMNVEGLRLERPRGDRWSEYLVDHPSLASLYVVDAQITDAQLRNLLTPNRLEHLTLIKTPVSGAGLIASQQLTNMQSLRLAVTKVTPESIFKLYGPQAREISIYPDNAQQWSSIYLNRPIVGPKVEWSGKFDSKDLILVEHVPHAEKFFLQSASGARGIFAQAQEVNKKMEGNSKAAIDDECLKIIARLPVLSDLHIQGVQKFSPDGLSTLADAKQLKSLTISSAGLTDDYVVMLGALTKLQKLNLSGNVFTSQGMKPLASLKNLVDLKLSVCLKLDSEAALAIRQMTRLKMLTARLTPIGDEGLKHLQGMPNLTTVDVSGPGVTKQGLRKLRDSLPTLNGGASSK